MLSLPNGSRPADVRHIIRACEQQLRESAKADTRLHDDLFMGGMLASTVSGQLIDTTALLPIIRQLAASDRVGLCDAFLDNPFLPFRETLLQYAFHERTVFLAARMPDATTIELGVWLYRDSPTAVVYRGGLSISQSKRGSFDVSCTPFWVARTQNDENGGVASAHAELALLAMELLRARQVRIAPPQRHIRRAATREQRPVDWHTVYIEPHVTKRLSEARLAARDGDGLRLHMVRGHEADYTQGRGLFGRWRVKVKVREHWRGDPERGILFTDRWVITDGKTS